ncbi:MAG TPA: helix-turn-helix transcriptional regulator [Pseudonocardiaceae bacterium]|nr:helix-turn-helix transcriptional regulator [Pseudonocardiaceae bacterium]
MVWHLTLDSHPESVLSTFADLLTGPTSRRALAQRDIAAVYRMLRDAGVTQASIAHATGQKQSEVSEIISGRQVQSVVLLERIADGLGIPRGWMGLAYEPNPAPAVQQDPQTGDLSDANLLRHAVAVLRGEPALGPAEPIRVRNTPTPVPRRVALIDVAQVAATTERLDQLARNLGGIPMTGALTAHTRNSEALLGAEMAEPVRQRLLVALADAHRNAASTAYDAGLGALARQHFIRSMDCAGASGELLRAVFALDCLGRLELDVELPNEALKLFQLGVAAAPSPLARAKVEFDCAWSLGLLGLDTEAIHTLRRAQGSYEEAQDEPRPWRHFASTLPHVEGCTYFALQRFDRAATALSAAIDGAGHAALCTVTNLSLLAAAQLRCGELRGGLATATRVIGLTKRLRSVAVRRGGLAPLQEAAAARRDSACQDLAREVAILRSAA